MSNMVRQESNELASNDMTPELMEKVLVGGDLTALSPGQRVQYYQAVCNSIGLNPLTRPFEYIKFQGQLKLYARRDCSDQLRKIHGVSTQIVSSETVNDCVIVRVKATDRNGRVDESTGAVSTQGLRGEALCNAIMKAETKAKRRATMSLCGLGWLDETEVETVPGAQPVNMDPMTGEVVESQALPGSSNSQREIELLIAAAESSDQLEEAKERVKEVWGKNVPNAIRAAYADRKRELAQAS